MQSKRRTRDALVRVDHTAIVVASLDEAIQRWINLTGAELEAREIVANQAVEMALLGVGDTRLELIQPTDGNSGVARFLAKRGESLHHIAFETTSIARAIRELQDDGYELIDPTPRVGADGLVAFLQPQSAGGVLVELIENLGESR